MSFRLGSRPFSRAVLVLVVGGLLAVIPVRAQTDSDQSAGAAADKTPASNSDSTIHTLIEKFSDVDANVRRAAANDAAKVGAPAVPALVEALKSEDEKVRENTRDALGEIGASAVPSMVELLKSTDEDMRVRAVQILLLVGPDAKEAVPVLRSLLHDPNKYIRTPALYALGGIGPDAAVVVPDLVQILKDEESDLFKRSRVIEVLGEIGPTAKEALPVVIEALTEDASCRENALDSLRKLGADVETALPILMKGLEENCPGSVEALGKLGPSAVPAVPLLMEKVKSVSKSSERSLATALGRMGKPAVPSLIEAYNNPNEQARVCVTHALSIIGPDAKEAIVVLALALRDENWDVVRYATQGLGKMGPESVPVLEGANGLRKRDVRYPEYYSTELENACERAKSQEKTRAIDESIASLGTDKQTPDSINTFIAGRQATVTAVEPVLHEMLRTLKEVPPERRADRAAIETSFGETTSLLSKIGAPSIPLLIKMLGWQFDSRAPLDAVIQAIADIGPDAVPKLIAVLGNVDPHKLFLATDALGRMGPPAQKAAPFLKALRDGQDGAIADAARRALEHIAGGTNDGSSEAIAALKTSDDPKARRTAACTLQSCGLNQPQATAALIEALKDKDEEVRLCAALTLGSRTPDGKEAIPALIESLKDASPSVRSAACRALSMFGPDAKDAVSLLTELAEHDDSRSKWDFLEQGLSMELPSFESNKSAVRVDAVEALGSIGSAAKQAAPLLTELLKTRSEEYGVRRESDLRCAAAKALAGIGPEAASAVPALIGVLDNPEDVINDSVFEALCAIGPAANQAIPRLLEIQKNRYNSQKQTTYYNLNSAIELMTKIHLTCRVLKKEIPCEREGLLHYELSLRIEGTPKPIFLARLLEASEGSVEPTEGFDESTLSFEWLEEGRFLHVSWDTLPTGQGIYSLQTHLLLLKENGQWKRIFRNTDAHIVHRLCHILQTYTFDPKTQTLTIREDNLSGIVSEGYMEDETEPVPEDILTEHKVAYAHKWRFRLKDSRLDYLDGKSTLHWDGEYISKCFGDTWAGAETHEYDIHEVAKFLEPKNPDAMVEKLRELNPALKSSDVCSGTVLYDTDVKWRGADERLYYSM